MFFRGPGELGLNSTETPRTVEGVPRRASRRVLDLSSEPSTQTHPYTFSAKVLQA